MLIIYKELVNPVCCTMHPQKLSFFFLRTSQPENQARETQHLLCDAVQTKIRSTPLELLGDALPMLNHSDESKLLSMIGQARLEYALRLCSDASLRLGRWIHCLQLWQSF